MSFEAKSLYPFQPERDLSQMHVGIIGGGPAGALTGLLLAREGMDVTIFEPRSKRMPEVGERKRLCVGCAGLLQENAIELLQSLDLNIPGEVIQAKLTNSVIHFPGGKTMVIPSHALTVYRGFGPVGTSEKIMGFDAWLLNEAEKAGAKIIEAQVTNVHSDGKNVDLESSVGSKTADFLVGAYGHNQVHMKLPEQDNPLGVPVTQPACVREYYLGYEKVKEKLGQSQHIFANPTPEIWYAAIYTKGSFISIALMGRNGASQNDYKDFLGLKAVQELIGDLEHMRLSCGCTSHITVRSPETVVVSNKEGGFHIANLGDAGGQRPRKNGIFASLDSAAKFAEVLRLYGNTPQAIKVFKRYITTNYVWDNWPSEVVLQSLDIFLNHEFPRKLIIYLGNGNVHLVSEAVRRTIDLVSSGRYPYWQIPMRAIFDIKR